MKEFTTKEAAQYLMNEVGMTKYAIAKQMDTSVPTINGWLRQSRVSEPFAKKFKKLFGITITDVYIPTWKQTNMLGAKKQ